MITQEEWEKRLADLKKTREHVRLPKGTRVVIGNEAGVVVGTYKDKYSVDLDNGQALGLVRVSEMRIEENL